jgi:hypothetical protein
MPLALRYWWGFPLGFEISMALVKVLEQLMILENPFHRLYQCQCLILLRIEKAKAVRL